MSCVFSGTPAGALRSLRVSDPAQEVSPHSKEALPGEVSHQQRALIHGWETMMTIVKHWITGDMASFGYKCTNEGLK